MTAMQAPIIFKPP